MKVAITGSKGFIGKHLTDKLKLLNIEFIEIDLQNGYDTTDRKTLTDLPRFDVLCHLAARVFVPYSYEFPYEFYNTNVVGTLNMLEVCRNFNAKMIFMSSYVYGVPQYQPIDELHPLNSFNPYSNTKIIGEQLCKGYNSDYKLPTIIIRPFNTYGIGQNPDFLIPSIINQAKSGKILLKDPKPKRDMLYISDLIDALVLAILYDKTTFEIFNLGFGESSSVLEIAQLVRALSNNSIEIEFSGETRPSEVSDTVADIRKARDILGWEPKITLEKGLQILLAKEINK
jgi:nucleoside-diphosphate-sugar epimerase